MTGVTSDLPFFANAVSAMSDERIARYLAVLDLEILSREDGLKKMIPARERHKKKIREERNG